MAEETTQAAAETAPAAETKTDLHEAGEQKTSGTGENPTGGEQTGGGQEKKEGQEPENKAEGKEPEAKQQEKKEDKAEDDYGDFAMPDGIAVDADSMKQFKTLAKELNLSKEGAQKLVDLRTGMVKAQIDAFKAQQDAWHAETVKEYGGKLEETLSKAAKFMDEFGGKELRKALDELGVSNHPALVRAFAKAGAAISEDKLVIGKAAKAEKSIAHRMFPQFDK